MQGKIAKAIEALKGPWHLKRMQRLTALKDGITILLHPRDAS
jgi:hypothetical protein